MATTRPVEVDRVDGERVDVVIVGGGLAGLAAAQALVARGCRVAVVEACRQLGGRAGSFQDPADGQWIDHCQHVALGCCTHFLAFCRATGVEPLLECHREIPLIGPGGEVGVLRAAAGLPAPLHLAPSLLRLPFLSWQERLAAIRGVLALARLDPADHPTTTVLPWLKAIGQPPRVIERFWQVILVSALSERLEHTALATARKVIVEGMLAHPRASWLYLPRVPLSELYDQHVANWLLARGALLYRGTTVRAVLQQGGQAAGVQLADGRQLPARDVLLAVPWRRVGELLPDVWVEQVDPGGRYATLPAAPIASAHLWCDRPLTDRRFAALAGRLSQWLFRRGPAPRPLGDSLPTAGSNVPPASRDGVYHQVVISAAYDLESQPREAVIARIWEELRDLFPAGRQAQLVRWRLLHQPQAVFSPRPEVEAMRPSQATCVPHLFLAGDWTRTGWPATMEGAVRSGYRAAEAILASRGQPAGLVPPELPTGWLIRRLTGCRTQQTCFMRGGAV